MRTALILALSLAAATAHSEGGYWDVTEATMVDVKPTRYEERVYVVDNANVEPAAGPRRAPRFRWGNSGRWQGGHVGVTLSHQKGETAYTGPSGVGATFKSKGTGVGAQGGYTWQTGPVTYGVVADISGVKAKGDDSFALGQKDQMKTKWQASARARLGFDAGRVMPYATAGWAWQSIDYMLEDPGLKRTSSHEETVNGPTYGGGIEIALSERISTGLEYRRTKYDETDFDAPVVISDRRFDHEDDTIVWSLNYRFAAPPKR